MSRILFVDDEERVLDGLRDLLRKERKRWEMTFALGGEAGIAALEQQSFDLVVTDMRMPRVDGGKVLEAAKQLQPQAGRIILSGQTELAAATRMVPVAHQFLTKPCDHTTLKAVIERVLDLIELVRDPRLQKLVGGIDRLPTAPKIYLALIEMLNSSSSSAKDAAHVLRQDPALSAKLLQLTNSAFFGLKRTVSSVDTAAALLGVETLRGLVLALGAFETLAEREGEERVATFQEHAVAAGDVALMIAADNPDREAIFAASLMHDIGLLLLMTRLPELQADVERARVSDGLSRSEAETLVLGVTHADIGAYLLGLWGLPAEIVEAVRYHHAPWKAPPSNRIAKLVGVAVRLSHVAAAPLTEPIPPEMLADPHCVAAIERWKKAFHERAA